MTEFVIPLDTAVARREQVGGKAANLAALRAGGFAVPEAFFITTASFARFLSADREVPSEVAAAILSAYARLDPDRRGVAVRSSAVGEDSGDASFAGLLDTVLNVRGEPALLDAVKQCYASIDSERARHYERARAGSVGVVVQRMVQPRAAGVMFTVNPVSGARDEVVINAVRGLGDALVAGQVTPDAVVVSRGDGRVSTSAAAIDAVLEERDARELARLGEAIERHFGTPQDIEWALDDERIWILQSRAITTHPGRAATDRPATLDPQSDAWPALDERPPTPFDRWTLANVGELWPQPVSPIVASTVPAIIGGAVRHSLRGLDPEAIDRVQWAKRWYGRVYYNEGALKHALSEGLGLPAALFDRSRGHRGGERSTIAFHIWPLVRRLPLLARFVVRLYTSSSEMRTVVADIERRTVGFDPADDRGDDLALLTQVQEWFDRTKYALCLQNDMSGYSLALFSILERLVGRWTGEPHLARDLVSGLADIQTADIGPGLADIARALRDAGLAELVRERPAGEALEYLRTEPRGAEALRSLQRFLDEHGHRCANDAEWLNPRWAEKPEEVIDMVASYLRLDPAPAPSATALRQQQRRRDTTELVERRLGAVRRMLFRFLLARTQDAVRLRDNGKDSAMKACYPARRSLYLLGVRWASRGWLAAADDVFFLTVPDLVAVMTAGGPGAAGVDLPAIVAARKRAYAYWFREPVHDVLGPDGQPVPDATEPRQRQDALRGIAASSGVMRGRARIVRSPREAMRLGRGDVLVTHATDTGWSAVFPLIGGLVTEIGGQLSHAAILAREYGLPAVVNVTDVTSLIGDGDTVTVDGIAGSVRIESRGGLVSTGASQMDVVRQDAVK